MVIKMDLCLFMIFMIYRFLINFKEDLKLIICYREYIF